MMRFYTKLNVEKKCGTEVVGPLRRIGGFNPRPFFLHKHWAKVVDIYYK